MPFVHETFLSMQSMQKTMRQCACARTRWSSSKEKFRHACPHDGHACLPRFTKVLNGMRSQLLASPGFASLRLEVKYQVFDCIDTHVFFSDMHVSGAHGLDIRVSLEDKDVSDPL